MYLKCAMALYQLPHTDMYPVEPVVNSYVQLEQLTVPLLLRKS